MKLSALKFIIDPVLALQASIVSEGKQIKLLADAVIVSVKDLGHDKMEPTERFLKICTMSFQYKNTLMIPEMKTKKHTG